MPENIVSCDDCGFWIDAHHYVINCNEEEWIDNPKFLYQASRIFGSANITIIIDD